MDNQRVLITGTEAEIASFVKTLAYVREVEVESVSAAKPSVAAGDRLGQQELVDVVLTLGTSVAGRAIYDLVLAAFRKFREDREHMLMEPLDDSADPDRAK